MRRVVWYFSRVRRDYDGFQFWCDGAWVPDSLPTLPHRRLTLRVYKVRDSKPSQYFSVRRIALNMPYLRLTYFHCIWYPITILAVKNASIAAHLATLKGPLSVPWSASTPDYEPTELKSSYSVKLKVSTQQNYCSNGQKIELDGGEAETKR